ncbi:hypothetical protein ACHWQZ_G014916 [Mnemiopsis leidyi]
MPIFGSQFERLLSKATDEQVTEPDWVGMLAMCDLVRQQETSPSSALSAIRKLLFHRNSQVVMNSLLVLECLVKNCGQPMHEQVTQYEFLEELKELVRTGYATVRTKVLSLVASWNEVFKGEYRYNSVKEAYDALKGEGFQFPELNSSEDIFDAARAPEWEDGRMCHLCRQLFTITKRKHHCRNCGQIFCAECTAERLPLPHFGIEKEVRVCSICASKVGNKAGDSAASGTASSSSSSASNRQPAVNPQVENEEAKRKQKELELKEKEELDLAIALSLSQQEAGPAARAPTPVTESSAPAENLYAEVEHIKPFKEQVAPQAMYYPDLSNVAVVPNGLYPTVNSQPTATAVSPPSHQPIQQAYQPQVQPMEEPPADNAYTQQIKDLTEMLMRKLNQAAMKGQHVGTDPHIQTLLASLTALHPKLVTDIEDTERKMKTQKLLLEKIGTCQQARESLNKMREEHLEKIRQQEEEQSVLMRLQMEQKLELLRQQKMEQLKYQEELKRRHEQAVFDRESAKAAAISAAAQAVSVAPGSTAQPVSAAPAPPVVMSTHVNPSNYVAPQPAVGVTQPQPQPTYQHPVYRQLPPQQMGHPPMGQPPGVYTSLPQYMGPPPGARAMMEQHYGPPQHHMGHPPQSMGHLPQVMGHPPQSMGQPPVSMGQPPQGQPPQSMAQPPQGMGHPGHMMGYPGQQPGPQQYAPRPIQQHEVQEPPQHQQPPPVSQHPPQEPAAPPPTSTYPQPQAPLSNRDVMSALNNAPAVPTEALPQPAQRERREDPPVADLISF